MHLTSLVTIILMACHIHAQTPAPENATDSVTTPDAAQNATSAGPAPTAPGADVPAQSNTTTTSNGASDGGKDLTSNSTTAGALGGSAMKAVPVPMTCEQGWMPFSEADLAAMANNGTRDEKRQANYSTIPMQVACKAGNETAPVGAVCAISSCDFQSPVCGSCTEQIITGDSITNSNVTVDSVKCVNNYIFGTENGTEHRMCTDGAKTYSCSGACVGYQSCKMCFTMNDTGIHGS